MASFGQLKLTDLGIQAQYDAQNGTPLKFTKIGIGSGEFTGNAETITSLVKEEVLIGISKAYMQNDAYVVTGSFSNEDLQTGFEWREIGLYFEDEDGNNVLYCYANAGDKYDSIPATTDERYTKTVRIVTAISNSENVSIVESSGNNYVEVDAYEKFKEEVNTHLSNESNPHKVSASNVGLGNVPNVATNDQAPTYTAATTLAALTSGEKLSVAFGKIAKAVSDLISHIENKSNPHGVTVSQIGAAAASHTHTEYAAASHTHDYAASSHTHSAGNISAGTFTGQVCANDTAMAAVGNGQVRNIYATASDLTAGSSSLASGHICLVYE